MPLFRGLPTNPHLKDVFQAFPEGVKPLLEYHDVVLRGASPFSVGERELIAAFVSGLNACTFCYGSHKIIAAKFGVPETIVDQLVKDIDSAPVEEKLKPVFKYVKKLNHLPATMNQRDAQAVFDVGWSERALYDAVQICALFNFMNRIIEGAGVSFDYEKETAAAEELRSRQDHSYSQFGERLGIKEET
jgi:uncharacterized peroxidase-related enzyme